MHLSRHITAFFLLPLSLSTKGQTISDSTVNLGRQVITLKPVVVNAKLNIAYFMDRVKTDTSFYKAFKNLRILGYHAIHDIRMQNKKGLSEAMYHSKTHQFRRNDCRFMQVLVEEVQGDFFDNKHHPNYYTAEMYASLFFTKYSVCNESNVVGNRSFNLSGKSGMEKHKEQLKMLFFNPGKRIYGLPFMSKKTAIYEEGLADCYSMEVDMDIRNGRDCFVFKQSVKPGKEEDVVVQQMNTWFDDSTYEVISRDYHLRYDAGVYDFDVSMQVDMTHHKELLVPSLIRYTGNWKVMFKRRERGVFTATLYDFE